jgi:hypothetical protein
MVSAAAKRHEEPTTNFDQFLGVVKGISGGHSAGHGEPKRGVVGQSRRRHISVFHDTTTTRVELSSHLAYTNRSGTKRTFAT